MIKITAVIVDRANYGRLKPLLLLMDKDKEIELSIVCCGSTVLRRFHLPCLDMTKNFVVTHKIYHEVEGSIGLSVVNSMSLLMPQLAMALTENRPNYVLIIGDRYEALAVATVAAMLKLCIIHIQGGEHSGNIDESIRHTITKLAHYHIPATTEAANYLVNGLGERSHNILTIGCPSVDLVKDTKRDVGLMNSILCIYHPEEDINNTIMTIQLLGQLEKLNKPVLMFWPNIDPGSDGINKIIRRYIDHHKPTWLTMLVNLDSIEYMAMLASVKCCVGNSSSFVRDASFFGTPVVLIGSRQTGRVKTPNIKWINGYDLTNLHVHIIEHMSKVFEPSEVYGKDGIGERIVRRIKEIQPYSLKVEHV